MACSVDGCPKETRGRRMCSMHAERVRRLGAPGPAVPMIQRGPAINKIVRSCVAGPNGCVVFVGGHVNGRSGHRVAYEAGRRVLAHRAMWEHYNGPIPAGLVVRHSCDNPPCVNINHLLIGTVTDNNRDRDERGRHVALRGSLNGNTTLTESDVAEIRRACAAGEPQRHIAERFSITQSAVHLIHARKSWRHVA